MMCRCSKGVPVLLLAVALASAGCRRAEPSEALEVWGWNIAAKALKERLPDFERAVPDAKAKVVMSGADMQSRLLLSLVARTGAPDVVQLQNRDVPRFAPSGRLLDLTERMAPYADQFPEAYLRSCRHDGRIYAVPWDAGPCGVFYKRSLFARYGIDPTAIETWDDYIRAGVLIVERSGGRTRMMNLSKIGLMDTFLILLQQNGGGLFDAEGRICFHSAPTEEVLAVLRRMLDSGMAAPVNTYTQEYFAAFKNDSIASYPIAVWVTGMIKENAPETAGDWGVFPLPAFRPGGLRASNLGGSVLAIPAETRHPEAAWRFVEFMLCRSGPQEAMYRSYGLFPAFLPALGSASIQQPDPFFAEQEVVRLLARDLERIPAMEQTKDWNEASRLVGEALSAWAGSCQSNADFMRQVEAMLTRKLGRKAVGDG